MQQSGVLTYQLASTVQNQLLVLVEIDDQRTTRSSEYRGHQLEAPLGDIRRVDLPRHAELAHASFAHRLPRDPVVCFEAQLIAQQIVTRQISRIAHTLGP